MFNLSVFSVYDNGTWCMDVMECREIKTFKKNILTIRGDHRPKAPTLLQQFSNKAVPSVAPKNSKICGILKRV